MGDGEGEDRPRVDERAANHSDQQRAEHLSDDERRQGAQGLQIGITPRRGRSLPKVSSLIGAPAARSAARCC